ncbi:MAG: PAS domain-containing sensor histidine kinase [Verrucomicrobiota bacterium]
MNTAIIDYSELFAHAPIGYAILNPSGIILQANHTIQELLKEGSERLQGKPFSGWVSERDRGPFLTRFQPAFSRFECTSIQCSLLSASGDPIFAILTAAPGPATSTSDSTVILLTVTPIVESRPTSRSQADGNGNRQAVNEPFPCKEDMAMLLAAIEQVSDTVLICDSEGIIQYANPAFTKISGYTREEAMGRNPDFLRSGKAPESFYEQMWGVIGQGKTWRGRFVNQRKDGSLYTEDTTITPVLDQQGNTSHFVAVKRDITTDLINDKHFQHVQKLESISTLAQGVAHEINNPINGIMNYAQLLADDLQSTDESLAEFARQIINETERVSSTISNLLCFARKEPQQIQVVSLRDIVDKTLALIGTSLQRDQIQVQVELPEDLPQVRCQGQAMQQVLMHLIANASDALKKKNTDAAGEKLISISAKPRRRGTVDDIMKPESTHLCDNTKDARPNSLDVRLTIEDNGVGIPAEILANIFDPFFTTNPRHERAGLGLYVSHGIVQEQSGLLSVESTSDVFTRIHIDLPAAETAAG